MSRMADYFQMCLLLCFSNSRIFSSTNISELCVLSVWICLGWNPLGHQT